MSLGKHASYIHKFVILKCRKLVIGEHILTLNRQSTCWVMDAW